MLFSSNKYSLRFSLSRFDHKYNSQVDGLEIFNLCTEYLLNSEEIYLLFDYV